ncbi:MAG: LamG-like jellyroll fold domain-containing protein, partial [Chthoniobacteraceae bacterium]
GAETRAKRRDGLVSDERLETLLDRYFDEALDDAEHSELESLLLSRPQARELFWRRARFNALLRRRGSESWGRRLAASPETKRTIWSRISTFWSRLGADTAPRWAWATAGAVAAALIAMAMYVRIPPTLWQREQMAVASSFTPNNLQGVATLIRAVGVEWREGDPHRSSVLPAGWLKIDEGLIELQFHRGAVLAVQGPAELELLSDMQVRCVLGTVRAEVPQSAVGFEVITPHMRLVDRGTEFGLRVNRDGAAQVHVFTGEVALAMPDQPAMRILRQGDAFAVQADGAAAPVTLQQEQFALLTTIEEQATSEMAQSLVRWKEHMQAVRRDPSLLVYYTFEEDRRSPRVLKNQAPRAKQETDGTVIGCSWAEGRWTGKRALDFKQLGDRIRFALPREHQSLTCIASVRLDALNHNYIALLMSGDGAVGELQWQIEGNGATSFGKRIHPGWGLGKTMKISTQPLIDPQRCGSWMQIAFVFDGRQGTVTQYFDGVAAGAPARLPGTRLVTKSLEIGNWTPMSGDPLEPIRNFNGRIDEFALFSRALSAEEVRRFAEAGSAP